MLPPREASSNRVTCSNKGDNVSTLELLGQALNVRQLLVPLRLHFFFRFSCFRLEKKKLRINHFACFEREVEMLGVIWLLALAGQPHSPPAPDFQLERAVVLFRHGDRTPLAALPDEKTSGWEDFWKSLVRHKTKTAAFKELLRLYGEAVDDEDEWKAQLTPRGRKQLKSAGAQVEKDFGNTFSLVLFLISQPFFLFSHSWYAKCRQKVGKGLS